MDDELLLEDERSSTDGERPSCYLRNRELWKSDIFVNKVDNLANKIDKLAGMVDCLAGKVDTLGQGPIFFGKWL